jgi:hypothetical protein
MQLLAVFLLGLAATIRADCPPSPLSKVAVSRVTKRIGGTAENVTLTLTNDLLESDISVLLSHSDPSRYSGQFVNVSYSGFSKPSKDEWIGLYLVSDNVSTTAPIAYQFAIFDPAYNTTGLSLAYIASLSV